MTATPTPATAPQPVRPVPALQAALAAEHTAVYGYGIAGAQLTGGDQAAAVADWRTHEQARDTLEAMIIQLGATPVAASPAYALPFAVNDARSARRLAAALEDGVTQAYLGLVAVSDTTLRTFGALAMQPPAQRAAAWRGSTVAFPGMGDLVLTWGLPAPISPGPACPAANPGAGPPEPQSRCCGRESTRAMAVAAASRSSAIAIRSAHDHQNHHMPSSQRWAYTFSSSARAAGFTTYIVGIRSGGAISQASSPRCVSSSTSLSR
jgi:hypothetical protein